MARLSSVASTDKEYTRERARIFAREARRVVIKRRKKIKMMYSVLAFSCNELLDTHIHTYIHTYTYTQ